MKKLILATALLAFGSMASAATTNTALGSAGGGGSTTVTSGASGNCVLLSADAKITLSAANIGVASCDSTTANMGVATGNLNGKGYVYSIGSTGGGITASSQQTDLSETAMRAKAVTDAAAKSALTS